MSKRNQYLTAGTATSSIDANIDSVTNSIPATSHITTMSNMN